MAWLKGWDKNTSFFHKVASMREKLNFISRLKKGEAWLSEYQEVSDHIVSFFQDLYLGPVQKGLFLTVSSLIVFLKLRGAG